MYGTSADEVAVGARHCRCEGLLEGVERRPRDAPCIGRGELDASVDIQQPSNLRDHLGGPLRALEREIPVELVAVAAARVAHQMDQRQRSLALVEVPVDLLPVLALAAGRSRSYRIAGTWLS
jgi:hypothetical protein